MKGGTYLENEWCLFASLAMLHRYIDLSAQTRNFGIRSKSAVRMSMVAIYLH